MSGAIPFLALNAFMTWAGTTLHFFLPYKTDYWLKKKRCCRAWVIDWLKLEDAMDWRSMWKRLRSWESDSNHPQWDYRDKQQESVEYFNSLGSAITSDVRCKHEITSRVSMAKVEFNKKTLFHQQIGLKFKEGTSEVLHMEHSCVLCWNLDTLASRSEIPEKFWNVVLEKDGEDQLDRPCEKWRSII
jgi:hypothetical protein